MEQKEAHLLALKVMRLSRPSFARNPVGVAVQPDSLLQVGKKELLEEHYNQLTNQKVTFEDEAIHRQAQVVPDFALGNAFILPRSFGHIYLGETFSSYLCINNDSTSTVQEISLKAELQTTSQRVTLYDTSELPHSNLIARQTSEFVVSHEIKELGVHILVCTISYTTPTGEKRSFRKFYKFQVLNPLAVKTKVNSSSPGSIFLEAQVQNVTSTPMYIERVRLEPFGMFDCEDLNGMPGSNISVFEPLGYLNSQDVRQYLYRLMPKSADTNISAIENLGKLDIVWRTTMGELGRLQTSQLIRKLPRTTMLEWILDKAPEHISVEREFTVRFRIRNVTKSPLNLSVYVIKEKMGSVLVAGDSLLNLGQLAVDDTLVFQMTFFPLNEGICTLDGLRIVDKSTGANVDSQSFEVFVRRHDDEPLIQF